MAKKLERQMYEEHFQMVPKLLVYKAVIGINPIPKKNSQKIIYNKRTEKPMIVQSDKHKQYVNKAWPFLMHRPKIPIDFPINIKYHFYRDTDKICDLSNLIAAADDLLTDCGIIADDNFHIVIGHDGSRVAVDRDNPRTEIYIQKMEAENGSSINS